MKQKLSDKEGRKYALEHDKIDIYYDGFIKGGLAVGFTDDQIDFLWFVITNLPKQ